MRSTRSSASSSSRSVLALRVTRNSSLLSIAGYVPGNVAMSFVATRLGPTAFFVVGTLLGYYPDDVTLVLGAWGLAIAVVAVHVGGRASWFVAAATTLLAARLVGPLPEIADLVMNGLR